MRIVLGIESSCDETAVALVREDRMILSQALSTQQAEHAPYGGVVPEIASRAHLEILDGVIERALADANKSLADMDAIAATAGPGGSVIAGHLPAPSGNTANAPQQLDASGQPLALPAPSRPSIDISQFEGQVRESSIKKVGEVVNSHPEEALAIIRTWLHEPA